MSHQICTDEQIEDALKKVFKKIHTVPSQNRLRQLVIKELNNNKFSRTIALELEACKNEACVKSSLDVINNILFDLSKYPNIESEVLGPPKSHRSSPIIDIFRKGKKLVLSLIGKGK